MSRPGIPLLVPSLASFYHLSNLASSLQRGDDQIVNIERQLANGGLEFDGSTDQFLLMREQPDKSLKPEYCSLASPAAAEIRIQLRRFFPKTSELYDILTLAVKEARYLRSLLFDSDYFIYPVAILKSSKWPPLISVVGGDRKPGKRSEGKFDVQFANRTSQKLQFWSSLELGSPTGGSFIHHFTLFNGPRFETGEPFAGPPHRFQSISADSIARLCQFAQQPRWSLLLEYFDEVFLRSPVKTRSEEVELAQLDEERMMKALVECKEALENSDKKGPRHFLARLDCSAYQLFGFSDRVDLLATTALTGDCDDMYKCFVALAIHSYRIAMETLEASQGGQVPSGDRPSVFRFLAQQYPIRGSDDELLLLRSFHVFQSALFTAKQIESQFDFYSNFTEWIRPWARRFLSRPAFAVNSEEIYKMSGAGTITLFVNHSDATEAVRIQYELLHRVYHPIDCNCRSQPSMSLAALTDRDLKAGISALMTLNDPATPNPFAAESLLRYLHAFYNDPEFRPLVTNWALRRPLPSSPREFETVLKFLFHRDDNADLKRNPDFLLQLFVGIQNAVADRHLEQLIEQELEALLDELELEGDEDGDEVDDGDDGGAEAKPKKKKNKKKKKKKKKKKQNDQPVEEKEKNPEEDDQDAKLSSEMKEIECPICCDSMDKSSSISLPCFDTHRFHRLCLCDWRREQWMKNAPFSCPICRKTIADEFQF